MQEIINAVQAIVDEAEYMKKAYFWTPDSSAGGRRSYERRHSHDLVEWDEGGHHYSAAYTVSCSCRNIYASGDYTKDGKKTTLLAIKNSLKRLQAAN